MSEKYIEKDLKMQRVIFFTVSVLFFISISSFDPYITPHANQMKIPLSQIGIILSVAGISSIIVRFPIGVFAEMFKRKKRLIQFGLALTTVTWLTAFFFPSAQTLFIGKIADGVTGATWVLYTVLFASFFRNEDIPKAIGIIQLADSIGPFIGMNIGGVLSKVIGYEYSYIVAVIAAAIGLLLLAFIKEEEDCSPADMKKAWGLGKTQLLDKDVWALGILASVIMMTTYAGRDLLTPLMADRLGGDAVSITILTNVFMVCNMVATVFASRYFNKHEKLAVRIVTIGAVGGGIIAVMMPFSTSLKVLYILQGFGGLFFGMVIPVLLALIIMGVPPEVQTSRMGLYQSIYSIGLAVGPMISGFILEVSSLRVTYMITAVAVIIIGFLTKVLLPMHLLEREKGEESLIAKVM